MVRAGVPAVLLATDAFERLAHLHAATAGMAALPVVAVRHPLGGLDRQAVRGRALEAYERLVAGRW
jgi:hypothetical protein